MSVARSSLWRRALPAAGLAALGAFALNALPQALRSAASGVAEAARARHDDARAALVRFRGVAYADGIARIRDVLPEDSEYLLLENDEAHATDLIVRFDLAPRRAIWGGNARDLRKNVNPDTLPKLPRWTVIPAVVAPGPRIVETRVLAETGTLP